MEYETHRNIYQFEVDVEILNALDIIEDYIIFVLINSKIGIISFAWILVSYYAIEKFKMIKPE